MTDLQHLQKVILGIAKDVDELCRENGIEYYLFGGSAIGAIRHQGFIPWDDDLDIIMTHDNYYRFIEICRKKLDDKYYLQEAQIDWPLLHSKIKLRGTIIHETGEYANKERGIFIDIFKLDNAAPSVVGRKWQYICSKYLLCHCLLQRGYKETTWIKKLLMCASFPLYLKPLRTFVSCQLVKYNDKSANFYGVFGSRNRYQSTFYKKELYSDPIYVKFEDIQLPVPRKYDECLSQAYGDYMTPPPQEARVSSHIQQVDFGKY